MREQTQPAGKISSRENSARTQFQGKIARDRAGSCWASSLIRRQSPSTTVIASDISKRDLRIGIRTAHDLGLRPGFFVACDAEKLPFQDETFDFVFGRAVIHHLSNVEKGISEMHRVLKNGGKYVGNRELMGSVFFKKIWRSKFLAKLIGRDTTEEIFFTRKDIHRYFKVCGFGKLGIKQETSWQYKTSDHHLAHIYRLVISRLPDFIINSFWLTEIDVVATRN